MRNLGDDEIERVAELLRRAHFRGWHLPGGFVGCGEDLPRARARLGETELGVAVRCWTGGAVVQPRRPRSDLH